MACKQKIVGKKSNMNHYTAYGIQSYSVNIWWWERTAHTPRLMIDILVPFTATSSICDSNMVTITHLFHHTLDHNASYTCRVVANNIIAIWYLQQMGYVPLHLKYMYMYTLPTLLPPRV